MLFLFATSHKIKVLNNLNNKKEVVFDTTHAIEEVFLCVKLHLSAVS